MANLEFEVKRAIEGRKDSGLKGGKFSGAMRTGENVAFAKGDVLQFPTEYVEGKNAFEGAFGEYIFVEDQNGNAKQFFPSTFWKHRDIYEEEVINGRKVPKATGASDETNGTAATLFKSFPTVDDAMQALKNKKIKVSDVRRIKTLSYGDNPRVVNQLVYQLDIVEDKK